VLFYYRKYVARQEEGLPLFEKKFEEVSSALFEFGAGNLAVSITPLIKLPQSQLNKN